VSIFAGDGIQLMARLARRYRIVVSAENNAYLAWQAKLFHFSCVSRLNRSPIVIVHDYDSKWRRDFQELADAGAIVSRAPELSHNIEWRQLPSQEHRRHIAARSAVVLSEGRIHRTL
jgi:hypothetical protein